jgi:hypothetical protein
VAFERRGGVIRLFGLLAVFALASAFLAWPSPAHGTGVTAQEATVTFGTSIDFKGSATGARMPIEQAGLVLKVRGDDFSYLGIAGVENVDPVRLSFRLDTQRNFLPPGSQVSYHWELRLKDGSTVSGPEAMVRYLDDRFRWQYVTSGPVTVYWYSGSEAFASRVAALAHETYQQLANQFQVAVSPIEIYSYSGTGDLVGALPRGSAEWIGGQTFPSHGIILVALDNNEGEMNRVIPHEVAHVVLWVASRNPYNDLPRWLDEGLAVYQELVDKGTYRATVDQAVRSGTLPSVRMLSSNFAYSPQVARLSYASSYSLVEFLMQRYGQRKVVELVRSFQGGLGYDEALLSILGSDLDDLNREWIQSLSGAAAMSEENPLRVSVLPVGIALVVLALILSVLRRR